MRFLLLTILFCFLINSSSVYSLVGVDSNSNVNLPTNIKKTVNNKQNNNSNDSILKTGPKPANIPDFPQDEKEEYKMLFDDGFANIVGDDFQTGEEWDVFVNQTTGNEINNKYIAGNDDNFNQMDALEAEKKTIVDQSLVDKNNITTHRTRVMAYLTLEQMLFDDLFSSVPYGYYVNAIAK
jgi:hypothetical protein